MFKNISARRTISYISLRKLYFAPRSYIYLILPSPSGKVENRAVFREDLTEGDDKSPNFTSFRFYPLSSWLSFHSVKPLSPKEKARKIISFRNFKWWRLIQKLDFVFFIAPFFVFKNILARCTISYISLRKLYFAPQSYIAAAVIFACRQVVL